MKCTRCTYKRPIKAKNIKFDYSKKSGIEGCFITAKEYVCPKCNNSITDLGDIDDINKAIAEVLAGAPMLTRQMIKYVRIHLFDESEFVFAKRIGANATVYSEVERFKRPMTEAMSEAVQEQIFKKFIKDKIGNIKIVI